MNGITTLITDIEAAKTAGVKHGPAVFQILIKSDDDGCGINMSCIYGRENLVVPVESGAKTGCISPNLALIVAEFLKDTFDKVAKDPEILAEFANQFLNNLRERAAQPDNE